MLHQPSDKIRHCYQRALEARDNALLSRNLERRSFFLRMEDRWLQLARNYEMTETLETFSAEVRHHLGKA